MKEAVACDSLFLTDNERRKRMTDIYRNSGGKDNMAVDRLDENRIRQYLSPEYSGTKIIVYDVTDSTNKQAKIYAKSKEDGDEIIAFVAEEQTEGRGRRGRSFYSPKATGVYLSLLLDVREQPDTVQLLTVATAVAVRESLNELFGIMPGIKWVNDLYFEGRKICGILAEAVNNTENGNIEKVVVGVGINCNTTEFPKEIEDVAGSFSTERIDRNELVAKLIGKIHEKVP